MSPARALVMYALAALAGLALTAGFLHSPLLGAEVRVGPWRTSLVSGSPEADPYTRAKVARVALLALSRQETLYYLAERDSAGAPLRSRCRYRVSGIAPPARWWSITAYAEDMFLFPDEGRRYSVGAAVVPAAGSVAQDEPSASAADAAGSAGAAHATGAAAASSLRSRRFDFVTGPTAPVDVTPWLATPGDRGLVFTLRLYNPAPELAADPARLEAPRIEAVDHGGACR